MSVRKVSFDPDKDNWNPSVLPGQIVVVATVNAAGEPNLAPKSWISMAVFDPPMLAFGCNTGHTTYQNIAATGEFVINVATEAVADRVWELIKHPGPERLERTGFTLLPAEKVRPPRVAECRAHLECAFDSVKQYGDEVMIFGRIVAASIDADCLEGTPPQQYLALRPVFFLENSTYGAIETAKRVDRPWPTEHPLYLVVFGPAPAAPGDQAVVDRHVAYLRELRDRGALVTAGPFGGASEAGAAGTEVEWATSAANGAPEPWAGALTGMAVLAAPSLAAATALVEADPLVRAGAGYTIWPWTRTF